jgi:uncharacterized phage protein (TIGR01671 family)
MRDLKFRMYALDIQKMFEMDSLNLPCTTNPNPASVYMQYTGLKDRNGKEIYEGDIIELLGETTEGFYRKDRFEIYWDDVNAQFALKRMDTLYLDLNMDLHESEVIGNVFDMPDWDF